MRCKRCNNTDPAYFYKGSKGWYCRKCIRFKRVLIEEELQPIQYPINDSDGEYQLGFKLTSKQKQLSDQCLDILINKGNVFLHCVCGSGKTEICLKAISHYLKLGKRVGFAIARREVVDELQQRMQKYFVRSKVIKVMGGFTKVLEGDLIILTTHQLYRYYQSFDLLILDEVDAFPFKGDDVLYNIALNSSKGQLIFSSATIDDGLKKKLTKIKDLEYLYLYQRPHGHPLAEPKIVLLPKTAQYLFLLYLLGNIKRKTIVFVPTISDSIRLHKVFKHFIDCSYVNSKVIDRSNIISGFRNGKYKVLFSTTILERGVTIENVAVIIFDASSRVYDRSSLIQMLGRIGRSARYPKGEAYILTSSLSRDIKEATREIREANEKAGF
jgi:competence protein ComFA